jgi:hypothetical protein
VPTVLPIAVSRPAQSITRAVTNLIACAAAGNELALDALLRTQGPEVASPPWLDRLRRSATVELLQLSNHRADGAGNGSVDVSWRWGSLGRTQHWLLAAAGDSWGLVAAGDLPNPPASGAVGIEVEISGSRIRVSHTEIVNPGVIELRVTNQTTDPVRFAILAAPAGTAVPPEIGAAPPAASRYAGDVTIAPDAQVELAFDGLPIEPIRLVLVAMPNGDGTAALAATLDVGAAVQP